MSMCTDLYQWWATCIRSDRYTDHRLSVKPRDHSAADGSVVGDEWCVLVRWVHVNADPIGEVRSRPVEFNTSQNVRALTFTGNGEYPVSGDEEDVWMWRVKDGEQVARMKGGYDPVHSLAASRNGKWIAAGTSRGLFLWDGQTYEQVLKHEEDDWIRSIDFSPDSTRLVTGTDNKTAIVWDLATGKQVQTLHHELKWVTAAKYSPRGDRIVTADPDDVRVWDSNNGRLLVDIKVTVTHWYNGSLLWFNDNLLVVARNTIKEFDASTGSKALEWPVSDTEHHSCIALPKHEQFIAFSSLRTVTFWDTSTHNQLPLTLQHPEDIRSIAFSPDDQILAIGGVGKKITIQSLSHITVGAESRRLWPV